MGSSSLLKMSHLVLPLYGFEQYISNGIPFAAFRDAILDNMNYQDILGDYLQDVTE